MKTVRLVSTIVFSSLVALVGCRSGGPGEVAQPPTAAKFQKTTYDSKAKTLSIVMADGTALTHYGVPVSVATEFSSQSYQMGFYRATIAPYYPTSKELKVGDIVFQPVSSKIFHGVSYQEPSNTLFLLRADGTVEEFTSVPTETYQAFLEAPVKNAYYVGNIESAFPKREQKTENAEEPEGSAGVPPIE